MNANFEAVHPVLMAPDVAAAVEFYRALGFRLLFLDAPDAPRYAGVARDNVELHIQRADAEQWAYPTDRPAVRIVVSDVDAIYKEFLERGNVNASTSQGSPWAAPANT